MICSQKQLVILVTIAGLAVLIISTMIWHHGRTAARLKTAETRLSWLEPQQPFLGIESHEVPTRQGEYNPAEFSLLADEKEYRRAYYSPEVNTNTAGQPDWCYGPRLSQINQHRLFLFVGGGAFFSDLWGILRLNKLPPNWYDQKSVYLLILNARVNDIFWQDEDLMVEVSPSPRGYQVIKVKNLSNTPPKAWLLDTNHEVWEQAYR